MAIPPIKITNTHSMYSQCNAQAAGMDEQGEEKRNRMERVVLLEGLLGRRFSKKWFFACASNLETPSEPLVLTEGTQSHEKLGHVQDTPPLSQLGQTTTTKNNFPWNKIRLHFPPISNTASLMVEVRGKYSLLAKSCMLLRIE